MTDDGERAPDESATGDEAGSTADAAEDRGTVRSGERQDAVESDGRSEPTESPSQSGQSDGKSVGLSSGQPADQPASQQSRRPTRRSTRGLVTAPLTKQLTKYVSVLFGGVGAGLGVMFLVLKQLGRPPITSSAQTGVSVDVAATQFVNQTAQFVIYLLPVLAAALAALVGVRAARERDAPDRDLAVAAGIAALTGTVVLVLVATYLIAFSFGTASASGGQQVVYRPGTVAFTNVVQNAVSYGVGAGVVGALAAYTTRNYA